MHFGYLLAPLSEHGSSHDAFLGFIWESALELPSRLIYRLRLKDCTWEWAQATYMSFPQHCWAMTLLGVFICRGAVSQKLGQAHLSSQAVEPPHPIAISCNSPTYQGKHIKQHGLEEKNRTGRDSNTRGRTHLLSRETP